MTPLFKEKTVIELLATEINNNFTQQQKEKLHFLIGTSDIVDYAGIKLLAKNIKNYLVDELYTIKHGQVLNILAKSYGFSNHHSMSASFEEKNIYYKGTTNVFKIFQAREELFDFFNENNITFKINDSSLTEFSLTYVFNDRDMLTFEDGYEEYNYYKRRKSEKYQIKLAINKLVRKYNMKPYKNTLPIVNFPFFRGVDIYKSRYLIVKEYQAFFKPHWMEGNNRDYNLLNEVSYIFLSYDDIIYKKAFLYVDRYSNDLQWDEIKNFLTFLIRYGEIDDYIFIESILKQEKNLPMVNRNTLSKNLLLRKYEKFKFTEDFMEEYEIFHRKSLKSILQSMKFVITLTKEDMQLLNKYADDVKDVISYFDFMNNLSTILMRCCIDNVHEKDRYSKIEKTLYLDFLHYEDESKIIEVKSINKSTNIVLVSRLAQLVEVACSRIEELIEKNKLDITV